MSCDVKPFMVRLMCLSMYWLHTTVIRQDRSRGKMIPKIIFILFVNLIIYSPANILISSNERLDYLDNELVKLLFPLLMLIMKGYSPRCPLQSHPLACIKIIYLS